MEKLHDENKLVVKSYADLKPYFNEKANLAQIRINNEFISKIEHIQKIATDGLNILSIVSEVKNKSKKLTVILTPKMKKALKEGTAKICYSHKDGKFFPKIQYQDGSSEFLSLENLAGTPNYTNIAILANQIQIQQTLISIQNLLLDFAEETDRQLTCLLRNSHQDRVLKAEHAKQNFNSFLQGNISKDFVVNSINEAFLNLKAEILNNIKDLKDIYNQIENKKLSFGIRKMIDKEQNLINFILEGIVHLQVIYNIEMYLAYERNLEIKDDIFEIQNKYSEFYIESFKEEELSLLSGLSRFDEDIWSTQLRPVLNQLKENKREVLLCKKNVPESITEKQLNT